MRADGGSIDALCIVQGEGKVCVSAMRAYHTAPSLGVGTLLGGWVNSHRSPSVLTC